jgi:FkbM family methyltransferase
MTLLENKMTSKHFDFIDIGTSDFRYTIPKDGECGMYVEPISDYINSIPDFENCIKENCAISEKSGFIDIHHISLKDIQKYKFPNWFRGCNSIIELSSHKTVMNVLNKRNIEVKDVVTILKVKALTIKDLFEKHNIKSVNTIKIDTEGYDCHIVKQILNYYKDADIDIQNIIFETNVLTEKSLLEGIVEQLHENNFMAKYRSNIDSHFVRKK